MKRSQIRNLAMLIIISMFLSSCSLLFSNRRFIEEMEGEDGYFVAGEDFKVVPGDIAGAGRSRSDIMDRTPSSASEKRNYIHISGLERELKSLEQRQSTEQFVQYEKYKDHFPSTSERIYFLGLRTMEERQEYLYSLGLVRDTFVANRQEVEVAIRTREVVLGMSKNEVVSSLGHPNRVDVAGNPRYENERWSYYSRGVLKQIYFESGRVQGWSMD